MYIDGVEFSPGVAETKDTRMQDKLENPQIDFIKLNISLNINGRFLSTNTLHLRVFVILS